MTIISLLNLNIFFGLATISHITPQVTPQVFDSTQLLYSQSLNTLKGRLQIAQDYLKSGQPIPAQRELDAILAANPPSDIKHKALTLLGTAYLQQGLFDQAITQYRQASHTDDPIIKLVSYNNLSNAFSLRERIQEQALNFLFLEGNQKKIQDLSKQLEQTQRLKHQYIQKALTLTNIVPNNFSVVRAYLNAHQLTQAHVSLNKLQATHRKILLLIELSQQLREPEFILKNALNTAIELSDPRGQALSLEALGHYHYTQGNLSLALTMTQQGIQEANAILAYDLLYRLRHQEGQIYKALEKLNYAKLSYEGAITALQQIRPQLASSNLEVQLLFREKIEPIYREYLTILLQDKSSPSYLQEALEIFDLLQLAQLESLFQDICLTNAIQSPQEFVQTTQSTLIHTILLENQLHVVATFPNGISHHQTFPLSKKQIQDKLLQWRSQLTDPSDNRHKRLGAELYNILIAPFKAELAKVKTKQLIFIQDSFFRNVPMSALFDSGNQQYLIEQYPITTALGLNFLTNTNLSKSSLLAFGLSEARSPFSNALPYVTQEVRDVINTLSGQGYLNEQFSTQTFKEKLLTQSPTLLHLATHAQFTGDKDSSFILTYTELLSLTDLEGILKLSPQIELLVLSACETSSGNDWAVLGLAGLAVRSGITSAMGSLWETQDFSSAIFMNSFYRNLKSGKLLAMQKTQIEQIKNQRHPFFWSNFILVGS